MTETKKKFSSASRRIMVRRLTYSAIMMALSVILTRMPFLTINLTSFLRIGFGSVPIVLTSLVCGPFWGLLVGAGSDLIGAFLAPAGDYFVGYTVDSALVGVLPWLTMFFLKGRKKSEGVTYLLLAAAAIIYSISFSSLFSVFKKHDLSTVMRILIPILTAVYFVIIGFCLAFLPKVPSLRDCLREERRFSLTDIYLVHLVNGILIGLFLKPMWNYLYVGVAYFYSAFADLLLFAIEGLLKSILTFFIINALFKADYTMAPYLSSLKKDKTETNKEAE